MRDELILTPKLLSQVEDVHVFIAAWFRGEVVCDRATFDAQFGCRLAPGMINIQPSGRALSKTQLINFIFDGHASNPAFAIAIHNFKLLLVSPAKDLALASYEEHQRNAKNTDPPGNVRISTVVFALSQAQAPTWLHLHETAMR